jgi:hypothetical protein
MPEGQGGRPASGFTTTDGTFELTTYKTKDGALPGQYRVVVQKTEAARDPRSANQTALERARIKFEQKQAQQDRQSQLPEDYGNFQTTPLRCTIPVTGVVTLDLDKEGKQ